MFTIAICFQYGLIPGIATAALTSLCIDFTLYPNRFNFPFVLCTLCIVFLVCYFKRNYVKYQEISAALLIHLFLLGLVSSLSVSILGELLNLVMGVLFDQKFHYTTDWYQIFFLRHGFPEPIAGFLSRLLVNTIDQLFSVFTGYGVFYLFARKKDKSS
ncbi:hypothetical protein Trebr_0531 [Treponema brennaborense DSM 12168]|uniref:Uncharacterized protein n=1 Tax=Treponema brennaborense (strain DSM 12168 / CIP 105900 / DD5/3) TaxID=906968 RepID=F4LPG3_TREBD|nr:hypothetical protein Trebr_0531 [Treponema brennaborense DSM 12168]